MRQLVAFLIAACGMHAAIAQTETSAFTLTGHGVATPFARDYQCLGINPANLDLPSGYEGKRFTLGFMELGVSVFSDVLTRDEVRQNIFRNRLQDLTQEQREELAFEFTNGTNGADIDLMTAGFALQTNKIGSFAFSSRERVNFYGKMGPQLAEVLWMGFNAPYFDQLVLQNGDTITNSGSLDEETLSQVVEGVASPVNAQNLSRLIAGTRYSFSWMREFNFGYGKRILSAENWQLHVGAGVKALIGQGILEVDATGSQTRVFSSMAPLFGINYSQLESPSESQLPSGAGSFSPVGFGLGFDVGATFTVKDRLVVSAAVTDIGSMTWDGNVYEWADGPVTSTSYSGLDNVGFLDQVLDIADTDGLVDWQGRPSYTTQLPTAGRFGMAFSGKVVRMGVDLVTPFNQSMGNIQQAFLAAGGELSPFRWLHLQAGVMQGGNYDWKIPVGIRFTTKEGARELGIASRDIITFFTENHPTASVAMGLLRFRF